MDASNREEVAGTPPDPMSGVYWLILIPLFFVAVAIAVIPVLYGTLKHDHWERREAAHKERQKSRVVTVDPVEYPRARQLHLHGALQEARAEAVALLTRIEHLERIGAQPEFDSLPD